MKLPANVHQLLVRRFEFKHRDWLVGDEPASFWPLTIALGMPTETVALKQIDTVRAWVNAWRDWQGEGDLYWSTPRWRVLGSQRLPDKLVLATARQAAAWAGELDRWTRAADREAMLTRRWPRFARRLGSLFAVLADYSEADFQRLVDVLDWINSNPASGLYPRQLPIAGLVTKWLDSRRPVLATLVSFLSEDELGEADFYSLCGLRRMPPQIRLRILDPNLRALVRGIGEITAPVDQIAELNLPALSVLIVENLQSGLALPDLPGTVAIIGLGYGVDLLGQISWLRNIQGRYWGDLDTHGFAILNRARTYLPNLDSFLMDEKTMKEFSSLWGTESRQHSGAVLKLLTDDEQNVYEALKRNLWGQNLRLEQERIAWPNVCAALYRDGGAQ
ncbi:MAG: Wadjet anti-phage system protein JetD domain-containing protein [Massilia sp.]